jgi:hypothetical protein
MRGNLYNSGWCRRCAEKPGTGFAVDKRLMLKEMRKNSFREKTATVPMRLQMQRIFI